MLPQLAVIGFVKLVLCQIKILEAYIMLSNPQCIFKEMFESTSVVQCIAVIECIAEFAVLLECTATMQYYYCYIAVVLSSGRIISAL